MELDQQFDVFRKAHHVCCFKFLYKSDAKAEPSPCIPRERGTSGTGTLYAGGESNSAKVVTMSSSFEIMEKLYIHTQAAQLCPFKIK